MIDRHERAPCLSLAKLAALGAYRKAMYKRASKQNHRFAPLLPDDPRRISQASPPTLVQPKDGRAAHSA
jgi:hypothetical protein